MIMVKPIWNVPFFFFFCSPPGEPIRPIDPAAWVSHTAAMTGIYPPYGMSPSMSTVTSTSSSISSSIPETERKRRLQTIFAQ